MKLLYPHDQATTAEVEEVLRIAIEGRKRVKDQILRIDATMMESNFGYDSLDGGWSAVTTLEEDEYPTHYHRLHSTAPPGGQLADSSEPVVSTAASSSVSPPAAGALQPELFRGQRDFLDNQRGISYETLLLPYLRDATTIELHDPYIRMGHRGRNLVELLALIAAAKDPADEVIVNLFTVLDQDPEYQTKQLTCSMTSFRELPSKGSSST